MPDGGTPFAIGVDSDGGQGGLYGFLSALDLLVLAGALLSLPRLARAAH